MLWQISDGIRGILIVQVITYQRFPPLLKGCPDHGKEKPFILHIHRWLFIPVKTDHRAPHIRLWHKTGGGNIYHHLGLCVILYRKGQRTVILGSGPHLHPVGYLLLHHDRNAL